MEREDYLYSYHNSYAAQMVDMVLRKGQPYVERVLSVLSYGVVVDESGTANYVSLTNALYKTTGKRFYDQPFLPYYLKHKYGDPEGSV